MKKCWIFLLFAACSSVDIEYSSDATPMSYDSCPICSGKWPLGEAGECHGIDPNCNIIVTPNNQSCYSGIGYCFNGDCVRPNCFNGALFQNKICYSDQDCDDNNSCTLDDCPEPGCSSCHHTPFMDGSSCFNGQICIQGACC